MSPLEEDLRRVFADSRRQVPPWPDATGRVRAGMRRRHRRRVTAAAGSVTLVVLVAIAVAVAGLRPPAPPPPTEPAPTPTLTSVPWLDLPAATYPRPTLGPRTATVACTAGNLELSPVFGNGAGGTQVYVVEVRNTAATPCTLSGVPVLRYSDGTKTRTGQTTQLTPHERLDPNALPATINPGETARLEIDTFGSCLDGRPETLYADARLVLADGSLLPLGLTLDATCGVQESQWSRPAPDGTLANPAWDVLTIALDLPPTVQIGQTLEYVVVVSNPSDAPVALTPCPNYQQSITFVKTGGFHQLNCSVPVIPPRAGVRFAMRVPIPDYTSATGPEKLTWQLQTDTPETAPTATGIVTLIR
jgi:hypothetical protein